MTPPTLTIWDLQRTTGVSARTLRRWTRDRLLPRSIGRGRAARYGDEHLLRAKEIRRLRAERRSINEIRAQLAGSSRVCPANLSAPAIADAPPELPEVGYPCTRWEVVQLGAGLVLLVDLAGGAAVRSLAAQLYRQCAAVE